MNVDFVVRKIDRVRVVFLNGVRVRVRKKLVLKSWCVLREEYGNFLKCRVRVRNLRRKIYGLHLFSFVSVSQFGSSTAIPIFIRMFCHDILVRWKGNKGRRVSFVPIKLNYPSPLIKSVFGDFQIWRAKLTPLPPNKHRRRKF